MNFNLINYYIKILQEPSVPANRVVRKVAAITLVLICALFYYRHVVLGFGLWEPFFVTIVLAFLLMVLLGLLGGAAAGAFYEAFLKKVDARNSDPSILVFFVECLFATTSPLLAVIFLYALSGTPDYI